MEIDNQNDHTVSGMGDLIITNYIGWHNKANNFHIAPALTITTPFGDYDKDDTLNLGQNIWKFFPAVLIQYRMPLGKGLFMIDYSGGFEFRTENSDIDYDYQDLMEHNFIFTYYPDISMKFGFFIQPDIQFALNETKIDGKKQGDGDFYTLGTAFGFQYTPRPNLMLYFKWSHEFKGRHAPAADAPHFMLTYLF